jgi:hypothetical protein
VNTHQGQIFDLLSLHVRTSLFLSRHVNKSKPIIRSGHHDPYVLSIPPLTYSHYRVNHEVHPGEVRHPPEEEVAVVEEVETLVQAVVKDRRRKPS